MYHHVKKLMFTVRVDEPDVALRQYASGTVGGANGELAAGDAVFDQGLNCEDPDRKDLLMDIGTESSVISRSSDSRRMHLKPSKFDRRARRRIP